MMFAMAYQHTVFCKAQNQKDALNQRESVIDLFKENVNCPYSLQNICREGKKHYKAHAGEYWRPLTAIISLGRLMCKRVIVNGKNVLEEKKNCYKTQKSIKKNKKKVIDNGFLLGYRIQKEKKENEKNKQEDYIMKIKNGSTIEEESEEPAIRSRRGSIWETIPEEKTEKQKENKKSKNNKIFYSMRANKNSPASTRPKPEKIIVDLDLIICKDNIMDFNQIERFLQPDLTLIEDDNEESHSISPRKGKRKPATLAQPLPELLTLLMLIVLK